MTAAFAALVSLIRSGTFLEHGPARSVLEVGRAALARDALVLLETVGRFEGNIELFQDGRQVFGGAAKLDGAKAVRVEMGTELSGSAWGAWKDLPDLLAYQHGKFLSAQPQDYFLITPGVASNEPTTDPALSGYRRLPALLAFLDQVADASYPVNGRARLVFVAGAGVSVPISYDASDLARVPLPEIMERALASVLAEPRRNDRVAIFKRVLVRTLQDSPESGRLARIIVRFPEILTAFEADFDHFASEFAFEKLRDAFERKRVDYMQKIGAAVDGVVAKVLAIPIGQAVVVSQFKNDAGAATANVALLLGSAIFTAIGVLLFVNQLMVLRELRKDVGEEESILVSKHPELHGRLKHVFSAAKRRSGWLGQTVTWVTALLLMAGFLFSLAAFDRVPPSNGVIERTISSLSSVDTAAEIEGPRLLNSHSQNWFGATSSDSESSSC